ncbi:hypothetical protein BDV38DRAFT_173104 [Aspergillus pseudotamarii]|uniref:Zn(2)-C6 fungal-type domain-containing protein n=1 Tax=Aspergillus pseudotamarii TaxID=132259 RepID=A0A5N6SJV6_ASPPS|nr:uncharacterized protein BDV38DRAFT_173104 [Aspergillus pseudotamarii]KAE8133971.1 hypothetical protein BDV38DRAFT_173104 [Aspergillus pseudotamarii]
MARSFYTLEDEVGFDPQSQQDVLSLSHPTQASSQQMVVDRIIGPNTAIPEGEKSRNATRRRIPVACNRCRKRKIKCSGDIGDGQGCSNCRSSGNTHCQFLRVNSSMLQTKATGWPYSFMNGTLSLAHQRQGTYISSVATRQELLSANPSNFRVTSLSRPPPAFCISSTEPQQSYSRPGFGQDHMANYDEDPSAAYGSQPAAYGVPTILPQGALGDYYGVPWSRTCHSGLSVTRGGLLPDHEAQGTFHHSDYAYIMSAPGTQSTDTGFVPSMVALSSAGQEADRTLPTPSGRNQLQSGLSVLPTSSDAISGLPQQDCRVGHPWTPKAIITANSARSMKQYTPEPFNAAPLNRAKPPPSNTQEMVLGYSPMTSASASSPLMPSCGTFTRLNPANSGEELQRSEEAPMRRPILTESARLSLVEDSSTIYGYCSSERRKGPKPGTSGMLMNGLPYTRPPEQLQSTSSSLAFSLPAADGLSDPGATVEAHRTQALSNPGGFYSEAC